MIVFKKADYPTQITTLRSSRLFLQTLRKSVTEPVQMASWPSFLSGVSSMHERVPVFYPHSEAALTEVRPARPLIGGHQVRGLVHYGSDDRFIAQWALTHLLQSQRISGNKNILALDCETTGINTGNSTDANSRPPSYPYEIGLHDASGAKTSSYMLKLPDTAPVAAAAAFATNRSQKGYLFWKTPLLDIRSVPGLADLYSTLSVLAPGETSGFYRREDVGSKACITHTDYDKPSAKSYEDAHDELAKLADTHAFMAFNCPFDSKMLHRIASHVGKNGAFKSAKFIDLLRPYSRIVGMPTLFASTNKDAYQWAALPRVDEQASHEAAGDAKLVMDLFHHLATVPPNIWSQDSSLIHMSTGLTFARSEQLRALWGVLRFGSMQNERGMVDTRSGAQLQPERVTGEEKDRVQNDFAKDSPAAQHYKDILSSYYDGTEHYFDGFWDAIRGMKLRDVQGSLLHPFHKDIPAFPEMLGQDAEGNATYDVAHDHTRWPVGSELDAPEVAQKHLIVRTPALHGQVLSIAPTRVRTGQRESDGTTTSISSMTTGALQHRPVRNLATIAHLFMQTRPMVLKDGKISLVPVHEITPDHIFLALPRPEKGPQQWTVTADYSKALHKHLLAAIDPHIPPDKKSDVAKDLWKITNNHAADTLSGTPPERYLPRGGGPHWKAELVLGATLLPAMHQLAVTHGVDSAALRAPVHDMIGTATQAPHALAFHPYDRPSSPTAPSPI